MPSTHKKVVVRKTDRDSVSGYVGPVFAYDNKLEMLNASGKVVSIPLDEVKGVYFVRDWDAPEEVVRKTFPTRPRSEGLWVRLHFKDQEILEGMMGNDLSQFMPEGFLITPPDLRGNTQKVFVPRSALQSFTVLGVVTSTMGKKRPASVGQAQPKLFAEAE
jgi:hypothetical protein